MVEKQEEEMKQALAISLIVLQLVPAVIDLIKKIEEAIPGQSRGEEKLAAVREILETTYGEISGIWPIMAKVISVLVGTFNKVGVFVKGE
jgi:hypothetical protein